MKFKEGEEVLLTGSDGTKCFRVTHVLKSPISEDEDWGVELHPAQETEREEWVRKYGSEHLKLGLELGLLGNLRELYINERMAMERPGWEIATFYCTKHFSPSYRQLRGLKKLRKDWPSCTLVSVTSREHVDGKKVVVMDKLGDATIYCHIPYVTGGKTTE